MVGDAVGEKQCIFIKLYKIDSDFMKVSMNYFCR